MSRLKPRSAVSFALVVTLLFVAAACGGDEEGETITLGGEGANDHGSEDVSAEGELDFELDDFYFAPTVLNGTSGQVITLHLENEGEEEHNFSLPDQEIDQDVEAGETADVSVTFPDSGTLVFFCEYHENMGMRGALRVE